MNGFIDYTAGFGKSLRNVERLFSYGGLVATDHRSSLSGEKLDQILFLRENALMANFDLGWN